MKIKLFFVLAGAAVVAVCGWSCKDKSIDVQVKNPREYNWTIETLTFPGSDQTMMEDLYAVDAQDIWVVGHNARANGVMYHFNGAEWNVISLKFGALSLTSIVGFGANEIWAVGAKFPNNSSPIGLVIRFDGVLWSEVDVGESEILDCCWGSSPSDVWFGGKDGVLLHFDGTTVRVDSVPMKIPSREVASWGFTAGASRDRENSTAVLAGPPIGMNVPWSFIFRRLAGGWMLIDSTAGVINRLWQSPWGKLYRTWYGVSYLDSLNWRDLGLPAFTRSVFGTTENNLFAVGTGVWHWNGTGWYEYTNLPSQQFTKYKVWTDGRQVFVVGTDGTNSYVLHGK